MGSLICGMRIFTDCSSSNVKELVGEVDFSFHVISTADSPEESLEKGKQD